MESRRMEAAEIAAFIFIMAVVFICGFAAGQNSVSDHVRDIDRRVEIAPYLK